MTKSESELPNVWIDREDLHQHLNTPKSEKSGKLCPINLTTEKWSDQDISNMELEEYTPAAPMRAEIERLKEEIEYLNLQLKMFGENYRMDQEMIRDLQKEIDSD